MSRVVLAGVAAALIPSGALAAGPVDWNRTYVGVQVGGAGLRSNWSVSDYGVGQQDA